MGLIPTLDEDAWLVAPRSLALPEGEIHIWRADTSSFAAHETMLTRLISAAEQQKANNFRERLDRNRSILARAALRDILGRYVDCHPRSLQFQVTSFGKPRLDPSLHANTPRFNLSGSGTLVLLSFTRTDEVGVDVEAVRDDLEVLEIARGYFSPCEFQELLQVPAACRSKAFFDGWTRKEAYVKARGEGIGYGLDRFAVTMQIDQPVRLISDDRFPKEIDEWFLETVPLGPDFSAAIAARRKGMRQRHWLWLTPV